MHSIKLSYLAIVGVLALAPSELQGQSIWELGTVPVGLGCAKPGLALPLPIFENITDFWFLPAHCVTYKGTVGCFDGLCRCNQGSDAYFNNAESMCLGKVGAICSAEHSTLVPDKPCTPNAQCVSMQEEGRSVGRCECLYGYKQVYQGLQAGRCVVDDAVDEKDRATAPTTTTTEAAPKEPFKLRLDLLLSKNTVQYSEACQPRALLNRTVCDLKSRTVACLDKQCQCNMEEDSVYDEELDMCVGLVGTWCLGRKNSLGYKACVANADCVGETGKPLGEGYSFGTCQCVYGYEEVVGSGTCERDESITDPSSVSPIVPTTTVKTSTTSATSPTTTTVQFTGSTETDTEENISTNAPPTTTPGTGEPTTSSAESVIQIKSFSFIFAVSLIVRYCFTR